MIKFCKSTLIPSSFFAISSIAIFFSFYHLYLCSGYSCCRSVLRNVKKFQPAFVRIYMLFLLFSCNIFNLSLLNREKNKTLLVLMQSFCFSCLFIGARFGLHWGDFSSHQAAEMFALHDKKFACDNCGKAYKWRESLVKHRRIECGKKPQFACEICGNRFMHKHHLIKHLYSIHQLAPINGNEMSMLHWFLLLK